MVHDELKNSLHLHYGHEILGISIVQDRSNFCVRAVRFIAFLWHFELTTQNYIIASNCSKWLNLFLATPEQTINVHKLNLVENKFRTQFLTRKAQNIFIASVHPSVRLSVSLSVCLSVWNQNLVVWKQYLTMMQTMHVRGPRSGSGPEKLSSAPRSTSSILMLVKRRNMSFDFRRRISATSWIWMLWLTLPWTMNAEEEWLCEQQSVCANYRDPGLGSEV